VDVNRPCQCPFHPWIESDPEKSCPKPATRRVRKRLEAGFDYYCADCLNDGGIVLGEPIPEGE
jgi:hypothetical protein